MGQGLGKTAQPKPAGGYQSVTGRRYGRRHSDVWFRPFLKNQQRDGHQQNDSEQLELEDAQKEISKYFCEDSSPLVQVSADLLDEPLSKDVGSREPVCRSASSQTSVMSTSPVSVFCHGLEGNQISQDLMNLYENSEDLAENTSGGHNDLNAKNGIDFVNTDSYAPDSSDGEEEDAIDKYFWIREAAGLIQGRLDNILSQCEKEVESLSGLQSPVCAFNHSIYRESCEEAGPMLFACPSIRALKSAEYQRIPKISPSDDSCEIQQIEHIVEAGIGPPLSVVDTINISDGEIDQANSSELVVRPKIRNQNTAKQLEREDCLPSDDEEESDSWRRIGIADVQKCHPECPLRDIKDEMSSGLFFFSRMHSYQKNSETDSRRNAVAREQNNVLSDSAFWNEFEDSNTHCLMSHSDEDSSKCSDGEWSASMPSHFIVEEEQSSSDERWVSVLCGKEHDPGVQRSSSGVEEESTDSCCQEGEQTLLEEGEIPWVQYREEVESSSDEENYLDGDFVNLGFLLLDGNNFEDDSSVSEDLDGEWRLLDEFGEVLGFIQAIHYMRYPLFTVMELGEYFNTVETLLAQFRSLTFDAEQIHPPATKEAIDCLPEIIVTSDYNGLGQGQCCTICYTEYVEGETMTELPCHHSFHKPCVTLWLQRSGTCPICRHVLAPVLPEAADDIDFFI